MEDKAKFTRELGELLSRYYDFGVSRLEYEICEDYELVKIIYNCGCEKEVNVHMDSLPALARDVLKNIE